MPYMYILECSDGTYYTGSTYNIDKRINEHNEGIGANYTSCRLPVRLVYFKEFTRIDEAFKFEKKVQRWSHAKKHALIDENWRQIHELAECRNVTHYRNFH